MNYECIESKRDGGWAVEAIDYENEGVVMRALFTGFGAALRAMEYANFQNGTDWSEVSRLRRDCGEAYQVVGHLMHCDGEPPPWWTNADVARALDNLSAATVGDPRPHEDLLPWPLGTKP